ncbi:unnamed protein product [Kuraishia capsulata CBS 1993]|uniref:25S rRNA (uridine-N(3))-methyltransferase BMT5-like domain-containing protein n=1 Tax=Kuraishia capsulata CBS 1993 TaxID=1382522 RepID=W6MRX0_9ASCO|nr:uncharacterized protein KUCA_T00000536001 [Kuraishia capsulata CBS 1993]CDK24570.1 unnamed protein product [Kuraishia capsulata CBS 1993]
MAKRFKQKNTRAGGKGLQSALARHTASTAKAKAVKTAEEHSKTVAEKINSKSKQHHKPQNFDYIPFSPEDKVMLIGEGDFSFALSVVTKGYVKPENLMATSYDSLESVKAKYPTEGEANVLKLEELGVKVFHEIDAQNLIQSFKLVKNFAKNKNKNRELLGGIDQFDLILFNFPHSGRGIKDMQRNIKYHQELLVNFFRSCGDFFKLLDSNRAMLAQRCTTSFGEDSIGGYAIGLKKNQRIPNKIGVTLFNGEPYDSWNTKRLARETINYKVHRSGAFLWRLFPGYNHRRTNSMKETTKPAAEREARIYVFEQYVEPENKKQKDSDDDE